MLSFAGLWLERLGIDVEEVFAQVCHKIRCELLQEALEARNDTRVFGGDLTDILLLDVVLITGKLLLHI